MQWPAAAGGGGGWAGGEAKRVRPGAAEWTEHWDDVQQLPYWHCAATGATEWQRPAPAAAPPPPPSAPPPAPAPSQWQEHWDEAQGAAYWHCAATGETTWERPAPGARIGPAASPATPAAARPQPAAGGGGAGGGGGGLVGTVPGLEGTVKLWNGEKGFGFIKPADGSQDVFVMRKIFSQGREGRLIMGGQVWYDHPVPNPKGAAGSITTNRVWGPAVDAGPAAGQLSGSVKLWNDQKGFGFIAPADGGQDVFVMRKSFSQTRDGRLVQGAVIHYDPPVPNPKGAADSIMTQRVQGPGVEADAAAPQQLLMIQQ